MTILDSGYSALEYRSVGVLGRIAALVRMEFGKIFRSKKGLFRFAAGVVYVVVLLVLVYFNLGPDTEQLARVKDGVARLSPRISPLTPEFSMSVMNAPKSSEWSLA